MKRLALLLILLGASHAHATCGTTRWAVKTLASPDVGLIDPTPVFQTVSYLGSLPHPAIPGLRRLAPYEYQTFHLTVILKSYYVEHDDDVHLRIADPMDPSKVMVAEIPHPDCVPLAYKAQMQRLRDQLTVAFGAPGPLNRTVGKIIDIEGVGYWDYIGTVAAIMQNYFELHPVTALFIPVTTPPLLTVTLPLGGVPVTNPVSIRAGDTRTGIVRMEIWVDGTKKYTIPGANVDTALTLVTGTRRVVIRSVLSTGTIFSQVVSVPVQ